MRQGELAALRWEDVDLDGPRSVVKVRRSAETRTKTVVTATKTGEERTVGIGPRTVEILEAHRQRQRVERMAAQAWADPGWVFPNTRGKVRRRDPRLACRPAGPRGLEDAWPQGSRYDTQALRPRARGHARRDHPGDGRALLTPHLAPTDPYQLQLSPTRDQLAGGEISAIIRHSATPSDSLMPHGLLRAESGLQDGPDL